MWSGVAAYDALIAPSSIWLILLQEYVRAVAAHTETAWVGELADRCLGTSSKA